MPGTPGKCQAQPHLPSLHDCHSWEEWQSFPFSCRTSNHSPSSNHTNHSSRPLPNPLTTLAPRHLTTFFRPIRFNHLPVRFQRTSHYNPEIYFGGPWGCALSDFTVLPIRYSFSIRCRFCLPYQPCPISYPLCRHAMTVLQSQRRSAVIQSICVIYLRSISTWHGQSTAEAVTTWVQERSYLKIRKPPI